VSTQEPAQRKRSRIEEMREEHARLHGPFEKVSPANHGAAPAVVPGSREHLAALFDIDVELLGDMRTVRFLAISAEEEGRKITKEMLEVLDAYLAANDIVLPDGVTVEFNTDPILLNPTGDIILSAPVNDLDDDLVDDAVEPTDAAAEDAMFKMWNRFTVDYSQHGADGTADRYKMDELVALAKFNGVDVDGLRKKLDVVRAIFA
jgi:hypothetical protein